MKFKIKKWNRKKEKHIIDRKATKDANIGGSYSVPIDRDVTGIYIYEELKTVMVFTRERTI